MTPRIVAALNELADAFDDYLSGGATVPPPAVAPAAPKQSSVCPIHLKEWKWSARGGYCPTKVGAGWCNEKPTP
jgi:hypothetical protein